MFRIGILCLLLYLSGCAIFIPPDPPVEYRHHKSGQRLSSAIETGIATGKRHNRFAYLNEPPSVILPPGEIVIDPVPEPGPAPFSAADLPDDLMIGGSQSIQRSIYAGKQFDSYYRTNLQFAAESGRSLYSIGLAITDFDFEQDWQYSRELKDPWSLDLNFSYRFYPLPKRKFFQPYIGGLLAYGQLYWSYNQPIVDQATGGEITSDSLEIMRLAAILGIDLNFSRHFRAGVDLQQDFTFHSVTTTKGFVDDVFEDYGATVLGLKLNLLF